MAYSILIHPYASPLPTLYKIQVLKSVPQLGLSYVSTWNGLKSNGFSVSIKTSKNGKFLASCSVVGAKSKFELLKCKKMLTFVMNLKLNMFTLLYLLSI